MLCGQCLAQSRCRWIRHCCCSADGRAPTGAAHPCNHGLLEGAHTQRQAGEANLRDGRGLSGTGGHRPFMPCRRHLLSNLRGLHGDTQPEGGSHRADVAVRVTGGRADQGRVLCDNLSPLKSR